MCWGSNRYGQLGSQSASDDGPTSVNLDKGAAFAELSFREISADSWIYCDVATKIGQRAIAVTAGRAHTCIVLQFGAAMCWGDNVFGQLGTRSTTNTNTAQPVDLGSGTIPLPPTGTYLTSIYHRLPEIAAIKLFCR